MKGLHINGKGGQLLKSGLIHKFGLVVVATIDVEGNAGGGRGVRSGQFVQCNQPLLTLQCRAP